MGVRTRSRAGSPVIKSPGKSSTTTEREQHEPVKVLIAPRSISSESRLLLLKHPRDDVPKRFLFCPLNGLHELTKIAASNIDPRSLLFTNIQSVQTAERATQRVDDELQDLKITKISDGFINKSTDVLAATGFDVVFLLLRILAPHSVSTKKAMYQPLDDILDIPDTEDKHFRHVLEQGRNLVEEAMCRICETVDAGDEKMFRYSESKVLGLIISKAERVVKQGLPASLEERFVTRPLDAPVLSVHREEVVSVTSAQTSTPDESFDSQSTVVSSTASAVFSEVSTTSTLVTVAEDTNAIPQEFYRLQRIRTAFNFITTSYLPSSLSARLQQALSSKDSPIDFEPLEDHLKNLAAMRSAALASRSISDYSRKREHADDDEAAEIRADKKRRQEEEDRKQKANMSRGVRDLKKVNVSGMKKMSDFFSKKPPTAKAKT